jgi:hypothetical protein
LQSAAMRCTDTRRATGKTSLWETMSMHCLVAGS